MKSILRQQLDAVKVRQLDMSLEEPSKNWTPSEADLQIAGEVFAGMVHHSRLTPLQVAGIMGYTDQSKILKWSKGEDLPLFFVRLVMALKLRAGLSIALAEAPGDHLHAKTVIEIDREVAS